MDSKLEDHQQLTIYDLINRKNTNGINIINHSKYSYQSDLYEEEIKQVFMYLNNLITKLSIEKDRLKNYKLLITEDKINVLRKNMRTSYNIINQLKRLISIENVRLSSLSNTVKDKHKLVNLTKKLNWMKNSIHLAIERYNEIRKFLDLPMDDLYTEIKNETKPFQLNYISKRRKEEIEQQIKFKETELIITDRRTSMDLLKSRIVDHGITPIYRLLNRNKSGPQSVYHYSCSLFGLYVEGNGNSKYEAKENTAAEMLRLILKKQKTLSLSSHIRAFSEKELQDLNPLIKSNTNYVNLLEKSCVKYKYPLPIYTLLPRTKNYLQLEDNYSVQCNAMDLVAIGHSNKQTAAKQISARNILNLWEEINLKNNPSK